MKNSEARWHFYRRAAIAPLALCLIATVHLVRVYVADQTPWKGGGFGMFSTVDGTSARFLRCYLLLPDGREFPFEIPSSLRKRATELRAAPNQQLLDQLATRLAKLDWVDVEARWQDINRQLGERSATRPVTGRKLHPAGSRELAEHRVGMPPPLVTASGHERYPVVYQAVRVELWRSSFDARTRQLTARRQLVADAPRPERS